MSLNPALAPQARFFALTANNNKMDSDASMFSLGEESDGYVPETVSNPFFYPSFVGTINRFAHCVPISLPPFAYFACQTASHSFNPSLQTYLHQTHFSPNTCVSALLHKHNLTFPQQKAKPKAAPKKAAARPPVKKMVQTTLKTKSAPRKRPTPESDDDDISIASGFSNTPPKAKKQKKEPAISKSSGAPLEELENDSMVIDSPAKPGKKKTATEMYTKLSQLEHILKRPDTYIGSVERTEQQMWVLNKESQLMEYKNVSFVPGLYKIFDEILVNAADNKQRDGSMTYMKINIDRENGVISVENNGKGIPIVIHEKEKIYIPELIFGHLLAGSNFDDDEKKTVGGRNGYGAKLCNVFSTEFNLECQDSEHGKRYKQTWRNNMQTMEKAKITSSKTSDFTRVTFKPDFKRFGMEDGIDDDLESLLHRRVYDMVGTIRGIKVFLNGEQIKIKDFKAYCDLYAKSIAKERSTEELSLIHI